MIPIHIDMTLDLCTPTTKSAPFRNQVQRKIHFWVYTFYTVYRTCVSNCTEKLNMADYRCYSPYFVSCEVYRKIISVHCM